MKNVKIDEKSKFLTAVLLVIVFIGVAFFLGYKKFEDKANALNGQNANLELRIAELKQYYDTEQKNKEDTERMTAEISDILSKYAGDARYEDGIYEAFNLYGASMNTLVLEKMVFAGDDTYTTIPAETVTAADIEGLSNDIAFNGFNVTYSGIIEYDGLKGMVREISSGNYNLGIVKMKYEVNGENFIEGTTALSFYYVTGAGLEYEQPPFEKYETGIENLFGVDWAGDLELLEN